MNRWVAGELPRVSVVVVSWNGLALLKQFLPVLAASEYSSLEVILADNASDDGSAEWVQDNLPHIRIVRHDKNYAFCRGNNLAYPYASGEYVVFLNNDVEVSPDWLTPMVRRMQADPSVAALQPKILSYADKGRFEYSGAAGGFLDRFGYPFTRGRIFFTTERDQGQYDDARDILWASGAAMMVRRTALDEVGLFDENFFMHMEEIDLCWRLRRAGYRVQYEPESVVYHVGAASLAETNPRKTYLNFRNNLLTLYKNLPAFRCRTLVFVRACLDSVAALRALVSGRPRETAAIVRAYRDAFVMRRLYRRARAVADSSHMLYRGSIVADYFLFGHRRFSDLPEGKLPHLGGAD